MYHVPAHKNVEHPAGQLSGNIGGELKLVKQIGRTYEDQFIPDPFTVKEAAVESPEFYMAKIADTLADMETLMVHMLKLMRGESDVEHASAP